MSRKLLGCHEKWTTFLIKLSLAFLGTKMWNHFLTGISFTLDHRFSFLKLRMRSLTFSCWLGLSIHYSLVLSSTGRTEAFEPRSLGFYNPTSFFFLCYQKSLSLHQVVPAALLETTSAMTTGPCITLPLLCNQMHRFCDSYCCLKAISITRPLEHKDRSTPYSCLYFKVHKSVTDARVCPKWGHQIKWIW